MMLKSYLKVIVMKSRILKYHYDNRYCELDGNKCSHCCKCDHLPTPKSSNWLSKILIACIIICIIIFVLNPILTAGLQHNVQKTPQTNTHDNKVATINSQMSSNERAYREYVGLGNETAGENYNSMKVITLTKNKPWI